ncbi:DUF6339 family protein [Cellulomonas citrea]|uniref:DUF6339 family protein n=1 Tax=Cellulomonas citrea TaxID=1909423 RepID=UPI00135A8341|nr:DUF6339 family protein [Cellulomonas citrea]
MTRLYPRLLPSEVDKAFALLAGLSPHAIELLGLQESGYVFAAAGGDRVSPDELAALRSELTACAREFGYPDTNRIDDLIAFDRTLARWLHRQLDIVPGEASSKAVWGYLGLVVAPHVAAWRFPSREPGYTRERFDGSDLTRNTFSRLWWRAAVLVDEDQPDPYRLVDLLGEEAIDQLMARRRSLAASPGLARAIVREASRRENDLDRSLLRDALQRLLRLSAFMDFEVMDDFELSRTVGEEFDASHQALRGA